MFKNKYLFLATVIIAIVMLTTLLLVLFKPISGEVSDKIEYSELVQNSEKTSESEVAESEQVNEKTSENEVVESEQVNEKTSENEVVESEQVNKETSESKVIESRQIIEKTSETKDVESIESKQDADETSKDKLECTSLQPTYIGRQVKDYVEPNAEELWAGQYDFLLKYKDTYQSNIVILPEDIQAIDIEAYAWFHPTSEFLFDNYGKTVQFVCYAILTYYDGKIPCDYYVNLDKDIHNRHYDSAVIFEIQLYGDKPLNICLDMYNYKIRVEEGIKKQD